MGSREGARKALEARRARREAQAIAAQEALRPAAESVRVVASGVDTLELHTVEPLRPVFVAQLEALKLQAAQAPLGAPGPTWTCAGHVFEVKRSGNRRGPLWLESEAMAVSINPHAPEQLPTAAVELRSRHLWQDLDAAAEEAEEVLSVLTEGEHPDAQVSRVDVTADWQGWTPAADLLDLWVSRARQDAAYRAQRIPTGWSWGGGGAVLCRIYDKTAEIDGTDKQDWFPAVWARSPGYVHGETTWRGEFQVRRQAIREFAGDELPRGALETWAGTRPHLKSLFETLATRWCCLRLPRTRDTRQLVDPRWQAVIDGAAFEGCGAAVSLRRLEAETEFRRTVEQLAACAARCVAERWAIDGQVGDATDTYVRLLKEVEKTLRRKGSSLDEKAREKFEPLQAAAAAYRARQAHRAQVHADERRAAVH